MHVYLADILCCLYGFSLLLLTPEMLYLGTPVHVTGSSAHTLTAAFLFKPCTCHIFCWFLKQKCSQYKFLHTPFPCNPPQLLEQNHSCIGADRVFQTLTAGSTIYTKDQATSTSPGGSMCSVPIFISRLT